MFEFITPAQLTGVILSLIIWYVIFVLGAKRSYDAGVELDDLPLSLKMKPYMLLRMVAFAGFAGLGYAMPPKYVVGMNTHKEILDMLSAGDLMGVIMAYALLFVLLFAFPAMTVRERRKRDDPAGE